MCPEIPGQSPSPDDGFHWPDDNSAAHSPDDLTELAGELAGELFPPASDPRLQGPALVSLQRPEQVVAVVPYLLRYIPADCVVALLARGGRIVLALVDDVPPGPDQATMFWAKHHRVLRRVQPDQVALLAYASRAATGTFRALAAASPVPVSDTLRVHGGRWWSLEPGSSSPDSGNPVADQPEVMAAFIGAHGVAPAASRAQLGAFLAPAPQPVRDGVAAAVTAIPGRDAAAGRTWTPATGYAELHAAWRARRDGPRALNDAEAARLLYALSHELVRDGCLSWHDDAAWWLWTGLIPLAPPAHVASVASLLAFTAYQRGDTATADIAAQHALAAQPGHDFAEFIQLFTMAMVPPAALTQSLHVIATRAQAAIGGASRATAPGAAPEPGHDEMGTGLHADPEPGHGPGPG